MKFGMEIRRNNFNYLERLFTYDFINFLITKREILYFARETYVLRHFSLC